MNDELIFLKDNKPKITDTGELYKVLIVDDDDDIHTVTKLAVQSLKYKSKGIEFISAYSAKEAKGILANNEIAVVFLDVVMETHTAGLDLARFIREDLKNETIRIIIRTGQPGEAPEKYVIDNYDINDYKEKTELTADKLYTTLRTALAQYSYIVDILNKKNELYNQLITDKLTQLPNRTKLNYDLDANQHKTLILINLDRFSLINDKYGFAMGDNVLIHVSDILRKIMKKDMKLYSLEADIFAITIDNDSKEYLNYELDTIQAVLNNTPLEMDEISLYINVTIGIVYYEIGNIIQKAELALRQARKVSRNRVEFYSDSLAMESDIVKNNDWTNRIANALDNDDILVYYQPIIECETGKVVKYEALVRLEYEDKIYTPNYFLTTARYAGYLHKITRVVFAKACSKFKDNELMVSINITDQDLSDNTIVDYIEEVRKINNIDRKRVVFEILEEVSLSENLVAKDNLEKLSSMGYGLSIDDFGTHCSNYAQLGSHDFESLKIDGMFIKDINLNKESKIITESILFFSKKMDFATVAEFVHSKEIFDIVKELGVTYAQGYYFGEPKPELLEVTHIN